MCYFYGAYSIPISADVRSEQFVNNFLPNTREQQVLNSRFL